MPKCIKMIGHWYDQALAFFGVKWGSFHEIGKILRSPLESWRCYSQAKISKVSVTFIATAARIKLDVANKETLAEIS